MKQYPKRYADISRTPDKDSPVFKNMGSSMGTLDELALKYRKFYREVHTITFDWIVKQIWLEQKFTYLGSRRSNRAGNGTQIDSAYSYFTHGIVGISQKPLTTNPLFFIIPTYFKDFFPNFSDHDPFVETGKEYYKYPYKHVTLDHMAFVYKCHNRLELLDEAEKRSMSIHDFKNWATNWLYCYNDEVDEIIYRVSLLNTTPIIRRLKKHGRK